MPDVSKTVDVVRVGRGERRVEGDRVAIEAPLDVRLGPDPFAVIMRTPGHDEDLAVGFLFSEGVARRPQDIARVEQTGPHSVRVDLEPASAARAAAALASRRNVAMNSSCGVCGRQDSSQLEIDAAPLALTWRVPVALALSLPDWLRGAQPAFAETGGIHAAGLFTIAGDLVAAAEDVGRHNAVDKIVGRLFRQGRAPLHDVMLAVSGRSSYEIVQKAWLAGVPLVAAVSAPSSLAVDLATRAGITLLGFVREGRGNVYTHDARLLTDVPSPLAEAR